MKPRRSAVVRLLLTDIFGKSRGSRDLSGHIHSTTQMKGGIGITKSRPDMRKEIHPMAKVSFSSDCLGRTLFCGKPDVSKEIGKVKFWTRWRKNCGLRLISWDSHIQAVFIEKGCDMIISINVTRGKILAAVLVSGIASFALDPWLRQKKRPEYAQFSRSSRDFQNFAKRIKIFHQETGYYPTNCVQLVGTNNLECLSDYLPRLEYTAYNPIRITDSGIDIDSVMAYTIACENGILAYEKRSVWRDKKVWICYDDMTFKRITFQELMDVLSEKPDEKMRNDTKNVKDKGVHRNMRREE